MALNDLQQPSQTVASGGITFSGAIPTPERLTLQREANDLHEQLVKANALLDVLTSAPASQADQKNSALMALGAAVSTSRSEAMRLNERLDQLIQAVGQI